MHLKRYEVADMGEAMSQIKRDLGLDAIILSTRKIRKRTGKFSLVGQPLYEVIAAAEPQGLQTSSISSLKFAAAVTPHPTAFPSGERGRKVNPLPASGRGRDAGFSATRGESRDEPARPPASGMDSLREELREMRGELHTLQGIVGGRQMPSPLKTRNLPKGLKGLYQQLITRGVAAEVADQLLEEVRGGRPAKALGEEAKLQEALKRVMIRKITALEPRAAGDHSPHVMAFVGPTGVGKTTTIAKLAAASTLLQRKRVALLTLDTYRIAAAEQLKIYGKILGTPVTVVLDREELGRVLREAQEFDVILIDTAGRCHRNAAHMWELKALLSQPWPIETHLVLNATTREEEAEEIFRQFSRIPFHSLLFTKLDESSSLGSLFNLAVRTAKPLSYLTTGQRVPEDIEVATPEKIVDFVLHGFWR